jgi:putative transcriptional regulator
VIRFRLAELIADAQFKSGRRIKLVDIAEATGINRMTLSRMTNVRGYSTSTDTIDKLCKYFGCDVVEVARYVEDESVADEVAMSGTVPPVTSRAPTKAAGSTAATSIPRRRAPAKK